MIAQLSTTPTPIPRPTRARLQQIRMARTRAGRIGAAFVSLLAVSACADDPPERTGSAVIVSTARTEPAGSTIAPDLTIADLAPLGSASGTPPTGSTALTTLSSATASTGTNTEAPATASGPAEPVAFNEVATFDTPIDLAVRAGDAAWYVVEQPGRVVRYDPATGSSAEVLDVTDRTSSNGEQGLLGLAFAPDGASAYINFTDDDGDTHVQRVAVEPDGSFTGSPTDVIVVDQPYSNHNGGALVFGPDGYLYIPLGDGGSANDPERRASDPTSLLGSILRIDPLGGQVDDVATPYVVPNDNPFANGPFDGIAGAPEVWAWGLRNPWRVAFDPANGDLWVADVGQNRFEEVNRVQPIADRPAGYGANFGWSAFEGTERLNEDVIDPGNLVWPVLTYEHGDDGCSVSGAAVYRGAALPSLSGDFIYGDYCSGKLWALDLASGRNDLLADDFEALTAVRTGPDGEVYVLEGSGAIHRLMAG